MKIGGDAKKPMDYLVGLLRDSSAAQRYGRRSPLGDLGSDAKRRRAGVSPNCSTIPRKTFVARRLGQSPISRRIKNRISTWNFRRFSRRRRIPVGWRTAVGFRYLRARSMSESTHPVANVMELSEENLRPTPVLDYQHKSIQEVANSLDRTKQEQLPYLQAAHAMLSECVAPVYTLDELQPASMTLASRKGSCSQQFACLEAFARAKSIATRVRGLWIDGRFLVASVSAGASVLATPNSPGMASVSPGRQLAGRRITFSTTSRSYGDAKPEGIHQ